MVSWKTGLTLCDQILGEVEINREIFQGDSLSCLLFMLLLNPLTLVLRRLKPGYEWGSRKFNTNHFQFMDDFQTVWEILRAT